MNARPQSVFRDTFTIYGNVDSFIQQTAMNQFEGGIKRFLSQLTLLLQFS